MLLLKHIPLLVSTLFICGCIGGFLVGVSGAGSTIVVLPALTVLLPSLLPYTCSYHIAVTTTLATACTAALVGTIKHYRKKNIEVKFWLKICPVYLLTGILGPECINIMPLNLFHTILASLLVIYSILIVFNVAYRDKKISLARGKTYEIYCVACCAGMISSMGGVATGMIMVPYLSSFLPRQKAIATSVASACVGCLIAVLSYVIFATLKSQKPLPNYSIGYIYLPVYLVLATAICIATPVGVKMSEHIPTRGINLILALLILCSAVYVGLN